MEFIAKDGSRELAPTVGSWYRGRNETPYSELPLGELMQYVGHGVFLLDLTTEDGERIKGNADQYDWMEEQDYVQERTFNVCFTRDVTEQAGYDIRAATAEEAAEKAKAMLDNGNCFWELSDVHGPITTTTTEI